MENRTLFRGETWLINGTANTNSSVFGHGDGNYIVAGEAQRTYFGSGKNNKSVSIREGEITVAGTDVLAKMKSLEEKIEQLEWTMANDYVKKGSEYYIKGHKDSWGTELGYSGYDARWHTDNTRMKIKIFA